MKSEAAARAAIALSVGYKPWPAKTPEEIMADMKRAFEVPVPPEPPVIEVMECTTAEVMRLTQHWKGDPDEIGAARRFFAVLLQAKMDQLYLAAYPVKVLEYEEAPRKIMTKPHNPNSAAARRARKRRFP